MSRVTLSGLDYSLEPTSSSFNLVDLTAANFTSQGVVLGSVQAAIQGVTLIAYDGSQYPAYVVPREEVAPASPFAQRESKWLVKMVDTVNQQKSTFEIGGADLALLVAGTDIMNISAGAGLALVTSIETNVRSNDGNTVQVTEIIHVGRSN